MLPRKVPVSHLYVAGAWAAFQWKSNPIGFQFGQASQHK